MNSVRGHIPWKLLSARLRSQALLKPTTCLTAARFSQPPGLDPAGFALRMNLRLQPKFPGWPPCFEVNLPRLTGFGRPAKLPRRVTIGAVRAAGTRGRRAFC